LDVQNYSFKRENKLFLKTSKDSKERRYTTITYIIKKNEISLGEIFHSNHYMDLVQANWKIVVEYLYEKMKNDNLKKQYKIK